MGLEFTPSQANFMLINTGKDAAKINGALLRKGVILRPVANYGMPNHMRVSVGLSAENKKAVQALKDVLLSERKRMILQRKTPWPQRHLCSANHYY